MENKLLEKTEGQSKIDNPERPATLGTEDRTKTNKTQKTQHRKLKRRATKNPQKAVPFCNLFKCHEYWSIMFFVCLLEGA